MISAEDRRTSLENELKVLLLPTDPADREDQAEQLAALGGVRRRFGPKDSPSGWAKLLLMPYGELGGCALPRAMTAVCSIDRANRQESAPDDVVSR